MKRGIPHDRNPANHRQTTIEVRNPADGSVVGSVPIDTPETVAAKARELRLFQPEWEALGARGRKRGC